MISFTFINKSGLSYNSFNDFGIYLTERPAFPRPERNIRFTEVDGKDSSLTEDFKTYKDIEIKLSCFMLNPDIENTISDNLNNWLNGEGGTLTFSFLTGKYFNVKKVNGFEVKVSSGQFGEFEVSFICEPYKYLNSGLTTTTITTTPKTITNLGTKESQPYLKVTGSGNITLTINSKNIILTNVNTYIEIDSSMPKCFKGTQNTDSQFSGEYPIFITGNNTISWTGTVTKIEYQGKWRCL